MILIVILILVIVFFIIKFSAQEKINQGYDLAFNEYQYVSKGGENKILLEKYTNFCYQNNMKNDVKGLTRNILKELGENQIIWGVKTDLDSGDSFLEYYFYISADWCLNMNIDQYYQKVKNVVKPYYNLNHNKIRDPSYLFCFSFDLTEQRKIDTLECYYHDLDNLSINENIFDTNKICVQQHLDRNEKKNIYIWKYDNHNPSFEQNIGFFPEELFIVRDYTSINICYKKNNVKAIYHSGVSIDDLLDLVDKLKKFMNTNQIENIEKFIQPIKKNYRQLEKMKFDVGYDFTNTIKKFAIYSWF